MSYATLQEIWPDFIASDKFQRFKNTLPKNIVNSLIQTSDSRGGNRSNGTPQTNNPNVEPIFYEKSREYPLASENERIEKFTNESSYGKYKTECSNILSHLSKCEKCRNFVRQKFIPQKNKDEEEEEDEDEENKDEEYLDLAIYIVNWYFHIICIRYVIKIW